MSTAGDVPLQHVYRPVPPWRDATHRTECGLVRPPDDMTLTRAEFDAKVKREGARRAALTTCMTCYETANRWGDWAADPAGVLARDINGWRDGARDEVQRELRALAALTAAHPAEWAAFMGDEVAAARQRRETR